MKRGSLLAHTPFLALFAAIFAVYLSSVNTPTAQAALPVPTTQGIYPYTGVPSPVTNGEPDLLKPLALGNAATGGAEFHLMIKLPEFEAPVDVYAAIQGDIFGNEYMIITVNGALQPLSQAGLVPIVSGSTKALALSPFSAPIPLSAVPTGDYTFYLLVTPPGSELDGPWYLWQTSLSVGSGDGTNTDDLPNLEDLSDVFMAGTQPEDGREFRNVSYCRACHGDYDAGGGDDGTEPDGVAEGPYETWQASMMAYSAKDPLFWALVAVENKLFATKGIAIGDYCLRCHVPKGWLESRSKPADGSLFEKNDLDGVQCDVCHRMVDPLSSQGADLVETPVDYYRNGQMVISDEDNTKLGPYSYETDRPNGASHNARQSNFHLSSEFCGTCHEITNPYYDNTVSVEKTFTEWKYSAYGDESSGDYTTCQECHMPLVTGHASNLGSFEEVPLRNNIAIHQFVGGNTWVPLAIQEFETDLDSSDQKALSKIPLIAKSMLQQAASIDLQTRENNLEVTITNLTGHKLPTGYTEGRRMWINVQFLDSAAGLVSESGAYDNGTAVLTLDAEVKVYEAKPGLEGVEGFADGPNFHFALNNKVFKDNRIPPKGFTNEKFENNGAFIVGASYLDGQNWDTSSYTIPAGAASAKVILYYQTTTKEFIEFLEQENIDNPYDINKAGEKIKEIWINTGKSAPTVMSQTEIQL